MNSKGLKRFFLRRDYWMGDRLDVFMTVRTDFDGQISIAIPDPVVIRVLERKDEVNIRPPFLTIGMEEAQQLMDEMWNVGLRPTEGSGSAGSLAATQRHLEDFRRLVFRHKYQPSPK